MRKIKPWEILEEKNISPSKWFPLYVHKVKLPNGKIVEDYYVSKLGDVAMIVAITKKKEIVFVKQYKHGVQEVLLELPAGMFREGKPIEIAKKELKEETGIIAKELIPLGDVYLLTPKDPIKTYGFLLNDAEFEVEQTLDDTEDIEIVCIPLKEIDSKITSGEIKTADTIALLNLAKIQFPELFKI